MKDGGFCGDGSKEEMLTGESIEEHSGASVQ